MAQTFIDTPRALSGTEREQLEQLYWDLYAMSEKLNSALTSISIEQINPEDRQALQTVQQAETQNNDNLRTTKSMIIKSSEIVRNEMEEIRETLEGHYTAISEQFGTYQQDITAQLQATAQGVEQAYNMIEEITSGDSETAAMVRRLNGNIFSGILDTTTGEVGIAIGYNVTNSDGTLNDTKKMATFTADKLTFWVNGIAAAWFSNQIFHISDGEVTRSMKMGSYVWKIMGSGAMGLMKT